MKRTQLNFSIDVAAFAMFSLLLSTGLLLQYQLAARSGERQGRGSGRGTADREIELLWGWTRHEWGQLHYWIAGVLLGVLATHLVLHWKWIVCVVRGTRSDASGVRFGVAAVSLVGLVLLAVAPFLVRTGYVTRSELQSQSTPEQVLRVELTGSMTLAEVAKATNSSVSELLKQLGIPGNVAPDERIGRLLRQHNLQMSDLRRIIEGNKPIAKEETEP